MWSSEATIFLHLHPDAGRFDGEDGGDGGGGQDVLIPVPSAYTNVIIILSAGKVLLCSKSK